MQSFEKYPLLDAHIKLCQLSLYTRSKITSFHQSESMIGLKRGSCPDDIADVRTWISPNLSSLFCESRSIVTDCSPGVVPRLNKKKYIYIIKQDIRIYVPYSRPNGWTDWAEIFCGHSGMAGG